MAPLSSKSRPLVLKQSQPEKLVGPPALSPYTGIRNKHSQPWNCRKMSTLCSSLWLISNCIGCPARSNCSKCDVSRHCPKKRKKGWGKSESLSKSPKESISTSVTGTSRTNSSKCPMQHWLGNKLGNAVINTSQSLVPLGYKIIHKMLQKLLANS